MAFRLLAADFDLTLSRTDRTVSSRTREAIRRVFAAGGYVTLATGRVPQAVRPYLDCIPEEVPLILCNGGILMSRSTGELLHETVMDPAAARAAMAWCADWEGACLVWTREGLFTDRCNEASAMYARITGHTPAAAPAPETLAEAGVYKVMLAGTEDTVARADRAVHAAPPAAVGAFISVANLLEIVPPGVDKAAGLRRAAEILGVAREETAAVGDGNNDIPMLRWAGLGAAMGNASDRVKAAADLVVPSCDEDGAAWLMETYLI